MYVHVYVYVYIYICNICMCMYTCTYVYIYMCIYIYIYVHKSIYIHTENRGEISAKKIHVLNTRIAFTFVHSFFFPHFFGTENGGETSAGEFDAICLFCTR